MIRAFTVGAFDYLYVTDYGSDKIYIYRINSTNGNLVAVTGSPFSVAGVAMNPCSPADVLTCSISRQTMEEIKLLAKLRSLQPLVSLQVLRQQHQ